MKRIALLASFALASACGGGNSPAPAAGSTGAFGIVNVGGKQKLYLPATDATTNHAVIQVIDAGQNGNGTTGAGGLIKSIDLGASEGATATGGDATVVIAASTNVRTIWFIDPTTDAITKTIMLPMTYGTSNFSGGGGYVTGIAIDSANHRAILSVYNGFALVDLQSQAITQNIQAPPVENFGYDSVNQRIIAPFYACDSAVDGNSAPLTFCGDYKTTAGAKITDGLNVIDLKKNIVYTYEDDTAADPTRPLGGEPDSAAIDPNNSIAVVPSEGDGVQYVLDLSKAAFDDAKKTFTVPAANRHAIMGQSMTGVAIESSNHLGFWEAEHTDDVGFISLSDASQGKGTFLHGHVPNTPDGSSWANLGDPHGIAVTTGLSNGVPVGFVVSADRKWVARIDLNKLAQLKPAVAGGDLSTTDMAPVVTFFDASKATP